MYNLKRGRGTYKGLAGECLFKLTRKNLVVNKFFNKSKYLNIFGQRLSEQQREFLIKNWYSIDAIEFDYNLKKFVLFEVKTMNDFYYAELNGLNRIPKFTLATIEIYKEALKMEFAVMVAKIWLKEDWNYDVELIDFEKCDYLIDEPKKYDKY